MRDLQRAIADIPPGALDLLTIFGVVLSALLVHGVTFRVLRRLAARTPGSVDDVYVAHAWRPARWILVAIALAGVRRPLRLPERWDDLWTQVAGLAVPLLMGWFAIVMIRASVKAVEIATDVSVADNLRARRRRTRSAILGRIAIIAVGFITICLMLLSIPSIRSIGVTLMASAGLAGLAVGAAAQPALKNIIAGIQMAFTEPIRIDDVVIVEKEWGRIEEIRLTYVVVRLWDERRLVVPVSKFLEESFENWTRTTSGLLGSAFFWLDPITNVPRLREHFETVVRADPLWDGRAFVLQVTDTKPDAIEVRILATASDAARAFDLRCSLREGMLAFIRDEMPEALPRRRVAIDGRPEAAEGAAA
ncbi:mechanosensitive ion channel family protein [Sphingomonas sp. CFBP 13720]|uniref:mechanosensitive ion channel family protein n=1 Tax=Sphingomonas sp. CFBP 13720 TaxID=2775302 RepID=UPI00177D1F93|nr:mechanosensitive ion channel domain-containing protein [Sphingomonas sp. CFBP 13720]MBD8679533.1 mechanosensitive ion channel [Sphingomonas sp. CFBP 13720]